MKNLFKKYYNSILSYDEFSEFSDYANDKKNEPFIYRLMKPFWDREMNDAEVSPIENRSLYQKVNEAILREKQKVARRKLRIYAWGLRVAAVLIVALLATNIFFLQNSGERQVSATIEKISTPYGAKTNFILPDGSVVWLNSGSTLSYPSKFSTNRPVTLVGEAYFEVAKNSKSFIVSTDYGDVEVKGTSFNVKAYSDDNSFETTLEEGVVAFKVKNNLNEVTLEPGEQVVKTPDGYKVTQVETKYFTSWKEGRLIFYKEPFPSFIKKLERWYNVKIEYVDPKLDELWYTGTIEMESISEVMEMISVAAPISYDFDTKTRVFTIRAK